MPTCQACVYEIQSIYRSGYTNGDCQVAAEMGCITGGQNRTNRWIDGYAKYVQTFREILENCALAVRGFFSLSLMSNSPADPWIQWIVDFANTHQVHEVENALQIELGLHEYH